MILRQYNDFNEAFFKLNKELFEDPEELGSVQPAKYMWEDVRVEVKSTKCDKIDMGRLGYKKGKWRHLLSHYYDETRAKELHTIMAGNKKDTITYVVDNSLGNGCIQSITFSRLNSKEPWSKIFIHWKVCQMEMKWAVDLVYLHKFIENCPNVKIDYIAMTFGKIFHNPLSIVFLCDSVFGCKFPKSTSKKERHKKLLALEKWRVPGVRYLNFASFAKNQKSYKIYIGDEPDTLEKFTVKDVSL
jgi:hypothetical protein